MVLLQPKIVTYSELTLFVQINLELKQNELAKNNKFGSDSELTRKKSIPLSKNKKLINSYSIFSSGFICLKLQFKRNIGLLNCLVVTFFLLLDFRQKLLAKNGMIEKHN